MEKQRIGKSMMMGKKKCCLCNKNISIESRTNEVVSRRQKVKDKNNERHVMLDKSLVYQVLGWSVEEFLTWLEEKQHLAEDESYKDLSNLAEVITETLNL
ncbi:spectrin alpha chain, non-erythrocytic 1-like [Ptychodera flava]|uniref:spectrin alpha chain, non-erythrocytic 1-like n=1 Tax=Ptychodera flava TaxID=63121 RepID=UPI00396A72C8